MTRKTQAVEMRRSWLIQRLSKPRQTTSVFGADNPFAFGGGLRNGGLTADAMDLLRPIFGFDYMGAAEFEFGAVPEALNKMALAQKTLTASVLTVPLAEVPASWRSPKDAPEPTGEAEVYILCRSEHAAEVRKRVLGFTAGVENLKERTRITSALRPVEDWDSDVQGWLELDNAFMFFTDRAMWEQTCAMFGVKVEVSA